MSRYQAVLLVAIILAALLTGFEAGRASASRPAPVIPAALNTFPQGEPDLERTGTPTDVLPPAAAAARPSPRLLRGIASWGRGWAGAVTRLPRGTRIDVCGRFGCWSGRSTGYGPARWTHRVADLSPAVFRELCGPLSIGLCRVTVTW